MPTQRAALLQPQRYFPPFCALQLLLGYLPLDRSQWPRLLQKKRAEYAQFCEVGQYGTGTARPPGARPVLIASSRWLPL